MRTTSAGIRTIRFLGPCRMLVFSMLLLATGCVSNPGQRTGTFEEVSYDWGRLVGEFVSIDLKDGEVVHGLVTAVNVQPDSTITIRVGKKPTLLDADASPVVRSVRIAEVAEVKGSTVGAIGTALLLALIGLFVVGRLIGSVSLPT